MVAATCRERLYLFGGVGGCTGTDSILDVSNVLWEFDPESLSWRRIAGLRPEPRARRCSGFAARGDQIDLWGGSGISQTNRGSWHYDFLNDHWRFDSRCEVWEEIRKSDDHRYTPEECSAEAADPSPRYVPVFETVGEQVFLFGGYTEDRLGKRTLEDTWIHEDGSWQQVGGGAKSRPEPRYGCTATSDGSAVYVFGGAGLESEYSDLWMFSVRSKEWERLSPDGGPRAPRPRYCAAMAQHDGRLVLFGGRSRWHPKLNYNDLWTFDLVESRWEVICADHDRDAYDGSTGVPGYHAKAAFTRCGSDLYLCGGEGRHGHVSDFWRLDLRSLEWTLLSAARNDDPILW
jgi:N-acetylneuraminic acid mutarotase